MTDAIFRPDFTPGDRLDLLAIAFAKAAVPYMDTRSALAALLRNLDGLAPARVVKAIPALSPAALEIYLAVVAGSDVPRPIAADDGMLKSPIYPAVDAVLLRLYGDLVDLTDGFREAIDQLAKDAREKAAARAQPARPPAGPTPGNGQAGPSVPIPLGSHLTPPAPGGRRS